MHSHTYTIKSWGVLAQSLQRTYDTGTQTYAHIPEAGARLLIVYNIHKYIHKFTFTPWHKIGACLLRVCNTRVTHAHKAQTHIWEAGACLPKVYNTNKYVHKFTYTHKSWGVLAQSLQCTCFTDTQTHTHTSEAGACLLRVYNTHKHIHEFTYTPWLGRVCSESTTYMTHGISYQNTARTFSRSRRV